MSPSYHAAQGKVANVSEPVLFIAVFRNIDRYSSFFATGLELDFLLSWLSCVRACQSLILIESVLLVSTCGVCDHCE